MSQAIYRKYRPKGWQEVIGQDHVVRTLRNAIAQGREVHAYLFAGPRGTGKTTLARILAKAMNCLATDPAMRPCNECENCIAVNEGRFLDLVEMDAASNTGVDDVRELRDKIGFSPSRGRFRVYIIDEVHMLSTAAFNALLKTLEEPPPHAIFVLATTEIHKIPATVLSRCQRHEFRRVPVDEMVSNLRIIVEAEGWQADDDALVVIARQATGSVRDAQSLLDQLASAGTRITLQLAQPVLGSATSQAILDLVDAIQQGAPATALEVLGATLDAGVDPRTLARQIMDYLRGLLFFAMGNDARVEATKDIRERMSAHAAALGRTRVLGLLKTFSAAASDTRGAWQPSLGLELALTEALADGDVARAPGAVPPATSGSSPTQDQGARPEPIRKPYGSATAYPDRGVAAGTESAGLRAVAESGAGDKAERESASILDPDQATPDADAAPVDLAKVAEAWKQIRGALKRSHPAVDGLLNSCKPVDVRGDELVLGFQSEAVRSLMDRTENLEAARRAIAAVLGRPVRIRCVVINARGKIPPNVVQDGMVATALNQGGEIVDLQD